MKTFFLTILLFLTAAACGRIDQEEETIQRQEEYEREQFEDEGEPVESTDEVNYYRDMINEGELDN